MPRSYEEGSGFRQDRIRQNERHREQVALFSYLTLCLVWDSYERKAQTGSDGAKL